MTNRPNRPDQYVPDIRVQRDLPPHPPQVPHAPQAPNASGASAPPASRAVLIAAWFLAAAVIGVGQFAYQRICNMAGNPPASGARIPIDSRSVAGDASGRSSDLPADPSSRFSSAPSNDLPSGPSGVFIEATPPDDSSSSQQSFQLGTPQDRQAAEAYLENELRRLIPENPDDFPPKN